MYDVTKRGSTSGLQPPFGTHYPDDRPVDYVDSGPASSALDDPVSKTREDIDRPDAPPTRQASRYDWYWD